MSKWKTVSLIALSMFGALQANAACRGEWIEGPTFAAGDTVIYKTVVYTAQVTHTAYVGANWNPAATPTLWKIGGSCSGVTATPTPSTAPTLAPTPTVKPSATPTSTPTATIAPTATPRPTATPTLNPTPTATATPTPTVTPSIAPTAAPTATPAPLPSGAPSQVVLQNRFDQYAVGVYQATQFKADWGIEPGESTGLPSGRLSIVADTSNLANKVLRVRYLAGKVGGNSAMTFDAPLALPAQSMFLQYKVRFDQAFTWVKGGKLPGLGGGDTPTGCIQNGTFDGFTTRLMWRENGVGFQYYYFPGKKEECGDYAGLARRFEAGRWYTLTQQVVLNDIGQANGEFRQWIDGELVLENNAMLLRNSANVSVSAIKMDTFFGGSSSDWAPVNDQYAYFDDFIVSADSPLGMVDTRSTPPSYNHPVAGYSQWQASSVYPANSVVYRVDANGQYRYFRARGYTAKGIDPLLNSILEVYVGVYSPIRLDTAQKWIEIAKP